MKKILFFLSICILGGIIYFFACSPDPVSNDDKDITGTISGLVTDTSGKALSGVSVTTDTGGYTSVTDTVGHYTIPYVKAGTYSLTFTKVDYADTTVGGVTIAKTEEVVNINMQMRYIPPFGTISGNVTDTSGVPLSGVSATTDSGGFTSVTDTLGNYTIPNITSGTYSLTFTIVTYADTTVDSVSVTAGQNTVGINARMRYLPQVGTISGNVTDTSGIALSGVSVTTDSGGFTSVTDTLGNYTIPSVDPGTYLLTFSKTDYADTTQDSVTVTKGVNVIGISVKMRYTPAYGAVFGTVCDSATGVLWPNVPILISPVGQTGISNANGEYLITQIPVDTYSVAAYSTYRSNTISNVIVIENDTTFITDTIWSVPNNLEEHDIYGNLTGNLSDIAGITATVTGDSIPEDNPIVTSLSWLPVSKQYTGFVYVPQEGLLWDVEVKVFDSNDRVTGYQRMAFDAGVGDIAMPAFDAWNAKPIALASSIQSEVSINDSINLKGSGVDTVYGTGIAKWEWDIGNTGNFIQTSTSDTTIVAPSSEDLNYIVILRVTDDEGNTGIDNTSITVLQDIPTADAGIDTIVSINDTFTVHGSGSDIYGNIVKYRFDTNCDGTFDDSSTTSGDKSFVAPSIAGDYNVLLQVEDDDGNTDNDTMVLSALQDIPTAIAGNDTTVNRNDTIQLYGSSSSDVFGYITEWKWDFGGTGTYIECLDGDTSIIAPDSFYNPYICILSVTDDDGNVDFDTAKIAISGIWSQVTASAEFPGRGKHSSLVYNDKIWVITGWGGLGHELPDVWYSSDGITWIQAADSAGFSKAKHTSLVYDNKMWVISGQGNNYENDVWYSTDGITWTQATDSTGFSGRKEHTSLVYNNKMWVIGGYDGMLSGRWQDDVWYSTDGITWIQATDSAGFSRGCHSSVVYDNKMWVIGGESSEHRNEYKNDVWYSTDGITWTQATSSAGFSIRCAHTSIVYNNKMWVIGGNTGLSNQLSDVWYSSDGITWSQATPSADFSNRGFHTSVIYNDKIWVIGGYYYFSSITYLNDVWCFE